jgi:hypothetical protein
MLEHQEVAQEAFWQAFEIKRRWLRAAIKADIGQSGLPANQ